LARIATTTKTETMLTPEQLLADRFKVIAPYPGHKAHGWNVGDILDRNWCEYENGDEDAGVIEWQLSDFPHLFRPLPWWSDRKPEEMPEYLHCPSRGTFHKVDKWDGASFVTDGKIKKQLANYTPATRAEYEAFNQKK
jgi:hypothetical protein